MEKLQSIINSPWAGSFGETILHSLWQGAIILGVYLILSKRFKSSHQQVNLGLFALFAQFGLSIFTFLPIPSKSTAIHMLATTISTNTIPP